ncbi:S8 family serine peptidase [Roseobacter sp. EG26]|uniref:S8 family serine peptidase n=1 Tax=Roseobacter sp. EG26 TaxID=3412477 RepID=UPI003CE59B64
MSRVILPFVLATLFAVAFPAISPNSLFAGWALADDDGDGDGDSDDDSDDRGSASGASGGAGEGRRPRTGNKGGNLLDLLFGRGSQVPSETPTPQPLPTRAADEVVSVNLSPEDLSTLTDRGYEVVRTSEVIALGATLRRLRIPPGISPDAALLEVRQLSSGQLSDFNHFYRANAAESKPCVGLHCPAFDLVDWSPPEPPFSGCGRKVVRLGLIDTGINPDHEAFINSRLSVLDFDPGGPGISGAQHGTAVAALLIGSREGRVHGVLPDAELVAVDAFYKMGRDERSDVFNIVLAMDQLAAADVGVINMSLAGPDNLLLGQMVARLSEDRILIVAAAGNAGPRAAPAYPGAYGQVLTVTAVDGDGRIYRRAGRGAHVDVAAPGVDVWTAASVRGVRTKTGTSFATPFATAAAAIVLWSDDEMAVTAVKSVLRRTARDLGKVGPDEVFGAGLVQFAPLCDAAEIGQPAQME